MSRNGRGGAIAIGIVLPVAVCACASAQGTPSGASPPTALAAVVTAQAPEVTAPDPQARWDSIPDQAVKRGPDQDPFPPVLHSDEWWPPVPLPAPVNSAGAEDSPFISPDGQTLIFFFTPDAQIPAERQLGDGVTGLYLTRRDGDTWREPTRLMLQLPGELALDGCGFLQGDTLWFCSARVGNLRGIDFWIAELHQDTPVQWRNAGARLNQELQIGEMHLSADGQVVYFHGLNPSGDVDLYAARWQDGEWSAAEPLAAVNTGETDGWPFVSEDGQELWFLRTYQGSPAIYRSRWSETGWSEADLIVSSFAGEPTLDTEGNLYFVHHFIADGVILEADIYWARHR